MGMYMYNVFAAEQEWRPAAGHDDQLLAVGCQDQEGAEGGHEWPVL